jgi:hypothetical protein
MTVKLLAPAGASPTIVTTKQGTSYTPDVNGMINVVPNLDDIIDLLAGGWTYVDGPAILGVLGLGTATFLPEGNVTRQISAAGINPGATGVDSVLAAFTLPANSFDALGRGLAITGQGSFAANANTKRIKIVFNPASAVVGQTVGAGGATIADTNAVTTNGGGWSVQANVFKYGAANSNTQIGLHQQAQIGGAVAALLAPSLIAAIENAAILIALTGNATTGVGDIISNFFELNAMN